MTGTDLTWATAAGIAAEVRAGRITAFEVTGRILDRIARMDPAINAFTDITASAALTEAEAVDAAIAAGRDPGPLAGVPFAVKNLFDVAGLPTRAGSKINRDRPPATEDAVLIRRMRAAGAVLVGALNMGEYAYDFTGENAHDGACLNPHDTSRMSGGSSSGCGAATAAGLAPISLGSDTNGSLRVPASMCGVFSLKPTYGRLPRTGTFSFVDSLDHLGPFARAPRDLALAYDAMQGHDAGDHACARRPPEPAVPGLDRDTGPLRVGLPGGWFARFGGDGTEAADHVARGLRRMGATLSRVDLDAAEAGRAAAYLVTNSESAAFHLDRLRSWAEDFDPDTRDRFLAGALLPAAWVARAQRVRAWWLDRALEAFDAVDLLIVPATPVSAPPVGQKELTLDGTPHPLRPTIGLLSQPFSCIGLPVVTVPVFEAGAMPIGVQIVARPWAEALALRVAEALARDGVVGARPPQIVEPQRAARAV
ncbi:AtzE family amidohydrolase [Rhodobacterales bacterium HKCCE2091]|nr:AtzE family amidohydrolase [Rhodobacterales bacterium HKCCE2091]